MKYKIAKNTVQELSLIHISLDGERNSITNQELLCRGWFLPPNTYDCLSLIHILPIHQLGTMVGSVFQDPRSQFFTTNTTEDVYKRQDKLRQLPLLIRGKKGKQLFTNLPAGFS